MGNMIIIIFYIIKIFCILFLTSRAITSLIREKIDQAFLFILAIIFVALINLKVIG